MASNFGSTLINYVKSGPDLTCYQLAILVAVERSAKTAERREAHRIAKLLNISRPAVTRATDKLEGMGLLTRVVPEYDQRRCILVATRKGLELVRMLDLGGRGLTGPDGKPIATLPPEKKPRVGRKPGWSAKTSNGEAASPE